MNEQRDPMALWVGTWTPDDAIDVEARRLSRDRDAARDGDLREPEGEVPSSQ